jgi:hypothetical protein
MRLTAGRRLLALAVFAPLAALDCTLLNSLDHLQAARGGDASGEDGASLEGGSGGVDSDDAPGCGPSRWVRCGVTQVPATPLQPGDAIFTNGAEIFSDRGTGELFEMHCTSAGCTSPVLLVSGEDAPNRLAFMSNSLFWTTATSIRRRVILPEDGAAPAETLDTIEGAAQITAVYPHVIWTDAKGVRGWALQGSVVSLWTGASSSPALPPPAVATYFISQNEVKRCDWDVTGVGPVTPIANSTNATLVDWSFVFSQVNFPSFQPARGLLATIMHSAGARLVVLDAPDDAGAPFVLAEETSPMRAIAASSANLYWTNAAGELRRRAKDAPGVTTVLHGLSDDTSLSLSETLVLITDRGNRRILTYAL